MECPFERNVSLQEMSSRLRAILLVQALNNPDLVCHSNIFESLTKSLKYNEGIREMRKFTDSDFKALLLKWGCTTGAMHNHEAICAHTDGNKSHPVETLSIYPRIAYDEEEVVNQNSNDFHDGYLGFPLHGFNIRITCGVDIIHCSLKNTIHLPDESRSLLNWSRVQGP